jgi:hypothetical protein
MNKENFIVLMETIEPAGDLEVARWQAECHRQRSEEHK